MNATEKTFKELLTNFEISEIEKIKKQMGNDFKDIYWSFSITDLRLILKHYLAQKHGNNATTKQA